ncbi:MAG: MOP flippase family protein [Bacteroidota bacterium]
MNLRQIAFSGIRWNIVSMFFNVFGGLIQLYLLVRLLDESDFGLMALLNVVTNFALIFMDFGVSNGIIHKEKVNPTQLSTLYWLTLLFSFVISLLVILLVPLIAWFFEEEALRSLLYIVVLVIILNSFGHPMRILMNKQLKFDQLAMINILGFLTSFVLTIFWAYNGYDVYALLYGLLGRTVVEGLCSLLLGWRSYGLQWTFDLRSVDFFLKFGSFQMGEHLLTFFTQQFDTLLIGKILGTEVLGSYDVIKRLLLRPLQTINPIITNVSFPLMSKVQQNIHTIAVLYLKQLNYICSLNFPIYLFLFVGSTSVIQLLFGAEWLVHEPLFQLLALAFATMSTGSPVGSLLLATGKADWGFYWNLLSFFIFPVTIYLGAYWGILGIATALLILQLCFVLPNYLLLIRPLIQSQWRVYFKQIFLPLSLALVMALVTGLLDYYLPLEGLWKLASLLFTGIGVYLGLSYRFNKQFILDLLTLAGYGKH